MAIQQVIMERRDNADREALGNAAVAVCKASRVQDGISSARFFWYGADTIVFLIEGDGAALDGPGTPESAAAAFAMSDLARLVSNWRLIDPRAGVDTYRRAGR